MSMCLAYRGSRSSSRNESTFCRLLVDADGCRYSSDSALVVVVCSGFTLRCAARCLSGLASFREMAYSTASPRSFRDTKCLESRAASSPPPDVLSLFMYSRDVLGWLTLSPVFDDRWCCDVSASLASILDMGLGGGGGSAWIPLLGLSDMASAFSGTLRLFPFACFPCQISFTLTSLTGDGCGRKYVLSSKLSSATRAGGSSS